MRALRIVPVFAVLFLAACGYDTQTSSGRDWLAAEPAVKDTKADGIDSAVRQAAAVEPTLRFPANIGLARVRYGRLSPIPADEAQVWSDAAGRLGPEFGHFVPISPLIAAMFQPDVRTGESGARETIDTIRLAAARQHLDAVIVYEVDATSDTKDNPLSLADWTLIGAFILPGRDVKAMGAAQAMLLDVRNGYPYGTVQAHAGDHDTSAAFHQRDTSAVLEDKVRAAAVANLGTETEAMLRKLKPELAALDKKRR